MRRELHELIAVVISSTKGLLGVGVDDCGGNLWKIVRHCLWCHTYYWEMSVLEKFKLPLSVVSHDYTHWKETFRVTWGCVISFLKKKGREYLMDLWMLILNNFFPGNHHMGMSKQPENDCYFLLITWPM